MSKRYWLMGPCCAPPDYRPYFNWEKLTVCATPGPHTNVGVDSSPENPGHSFASITKTKRLEHSLVPDPATSSTDAYGQRIDRSETDTGDVLYTHTIIDNNPIRSCDDGSVTGLNQTFTVTGNRSYFSTVHIENYHTVNGIAQPPYDVEDYETTIDETYAVDEPIPGTFRVTKTITKRKIYSSTQSPQNNTDVTTVSTEAEQGNLLLIDRGEREAAVEIINGNTPNWITEHSSTNPYTSKSTYMTSVSNELVEADFITKMDAIEADQNWQFALDIEANNLRVLDDVWVRPTPSTGYKTFILDRRSRQKLRGKITLPFNPTTPNWKGTYYNIKWRIKHTDESNVISYDPEQETELNLNDGLYLEIPPPLGYGKSDPELIAYQCFRGAPWVDF